MQVADFIQGKFKPRTEFIEIPRLCGLCKTPYVDTLEAIEGETPEDRKARQDEDRKAYCTGGEKPCAFFKVEEDGSYQVGVEVRGMDGIEHARVQAGGQKMLKEIIEKMMAEIGGAGTVSAFADFLGISGAPQELEQQIMFLQVGLTWPPFKSDEKVRFAAFLNKHLRHDFITIYHKIVRLTGEGSCPVG